MTRKLIALSTAFILVCFGAAGARSQSSQSSEFQSISRKEVELLINDLAQKNPMAVRRISEDPALKIKQLENLRQLLAFARQAEREGLAGKNHQELDNIRLEVIATNYDAEINKANPPNPQFGSITALQIDQYWNDATQKAPREAEFQKFINSQIDLLKQQNPRFDERLSEEDRQQARDYFAKVRIYSDEYAAKSNKGLLAPEFIQRTDLQVKLQRAEFLAKIYSDTVADKAIVTDSEIAQYIEEHPEFNTDAKKAKALEILKRAKAGEDFASLANEFTEDPGNKGNQGRLNGGLYKDVRKGTMVEPFERAALALEPGQISPDLVESEFGFHIIKLEKKADLRNPSGNPTQVYDVRHILIMTTYKDPYDASSQARPIREYVKQKLSDQKQKKIIDDILAANHISVPDDYTLPKVEVPARATPKTAAARKTKTAVRHRKRPVKKGLKR